MQENMNSFRSLAAAATLLSIFGSLLAGAQEVTAPVKPTFSADVPESVTTPDIVFSERLGELRFFDGMPSDETVNKVYDNLDFARGVEVFLQGIPATSIYGLLEGLKGAGMGPFEVVITEQLLDARGLFLTGNSTTMYFSTEINLKAEPVVLEVPPMVLGMINDAYFRYVADIGLTGPDKGKGGKYLFVGPDYDGAIPDGYYVFRSKTYRHWLMSRAFVIDGDLEGAANCIKRSLKIYPLSQAENPPEQTFVNISGKHFNTIHANNFEFFHELDAVIQFEPADAFSPELVGFFASIGIKKGTPFAPDQRMKAILTDAVAVGNATARAISFAPRDKDIFYYPDRRWFAVFAGGSYEFLNEGERVLNGRTLFHYLATGITPAMARSSVGQGSAYALASQDNEGQYLDGGKTYRIVLPGPVPAQNFWSFTAYSSQHRSMLETDQKTAGIDSNSPSLQPNSDGSYTVWFGPTAPEGQEGNWVQTIAGKSWFTLMRLYGPLNPWFEKTWKPGDFEVVE